MKDKRIGFVGLGRMGANMARCLNDKDYNVSAVFDINDTVTTELAAEVGAMCILEGVEVDPGI